MILSVFSVCFLCVFCVRACTSALRSVLMLPVWLYVHSGPSAKVVPMRQCSTSPRRAATRRGCAAAPSWMPKSFTRMRRWPGRSSSTCPNWAWKPMRRVCRRCLYSVNPPSVHVSLQQCCWVLSFAEVLISPETLSRSSSGTHWQGILKWLNSKDFVDSPIFHAITPIASKAPTA